MFLFCYKNTNVSFLYSKDTKLKIFCSYWQDYNLIFDMLLKQEYDLELQKWQGF